LTITLIVEHVQK